MIVIMTFSIAVTDKLKANDFFLYEIANLFGQQLFVIVQHHCDNEG